MENCNKFKTIVFAGGGSRCLWQSGFLEVIRGECELKPDIVAGVSAGAAI